MKKYLQLLNCLYTICILFFAFRVGGNILVNQENIFCSNLLTLSKGTNCEFNME